MTEYNRGHKMLDELADELASASSWIDLKIVLKKLLPLLKEAL